MSRTTSKMLLRYGGAVEIDLSIHPPPDLVVEIDLSHSSIPKQHLFASMQVPEVWRFDGSKLAVLGLDCDRYVELEFSRVLPLFPLKAARQLLARRDDESETKLMQQIQ